MRVTSPRLILGADVVVVVVLVDELWWPVGGTRALVGAWREQNLLKGLTPEDLELREGCTVFLKYDGNGRFVGGTEGNGCLSGLRGATYATSEVIVGPGRIESWDRGFDAEGVQVWGAEKGAYVFLRENETPE